MADAQNIRQSLNALSINDFDKTAVDEIVVAYEKLIRAQQDFHGSIGFDRLEKVEECNKTGYFGLLMVHFMKMYHIPPIERQPVAIPFQGF